MTGFVRWNNDAKYEDAETLEEVINAYFAKPINFKRILSIESGQWEDFPIYTVSGLSLSLGFTSRSALYRYTQDKNKNSHVNELIKKAIHFIESVYEAKAQSVSAVHFLLKNMGWKDKTEVHTDTDITINYGHRKPIDEPKS